MKRASLERNALILQPPRDLTLNRYDVVGSGANADPQGAGRTMRRENSMPGKFETERRQADVLAHRLLDRAHAIRRDLAREDERDVPVIGAHPAQRVAVDPSGKAPLFERDASSRRIVELNRGKQPSHSGHGAWLGFAGFSAPQGSPRLTVSMSWLPPAGMAPVLQPAVHRVAGFGPRPWANAFSSARAPISSPTIPWLPSWHRGSL